MTLIGFEPETFRPVIRSASHYATEAGGPACPSGKALCWNAEGTPFAFAFALLFLLKLWFMDTVFVTLPFAIAETLKRFSSLPILTQESFWR